MKKATLVYSLCCSLLLAMTVSGGPQLKDTTESRFKVGQVWSYWTRSHEQNSSFVVLKVEKRPRLGNIVHIALRGLRIRMANGGLIETVGHVALTEDAMDRSGAKLLTEKVDLPDFEEGYRSWREAFESKRGGVYAISIAKAVEEMESYLNRGALASPKTNFKILSERRPFIYQIYHAATNKTEVRAILGDDSQMPGLLLFFPEQSGVHIPYQSDILLGAAHLDYVGPSASGAPHGRFTFITKRKEAFPDSPLFSISVEGQAIHDGQAELYLSGYSVNTSKAERQVVTLKVPIDVFRRVAAAKKVEFKIGPKSYKPEGFQQKYLRALAKLLEPQTK